MFYLVYSSRAGRSAREASVLGSCLISLVRNGLSMPLDTIMYAEDFADVTCPVGLGLFTICVVLWWAYGVQASYSKCLVFVSNVAGFKYC